MTARATGEAMKRIGDLVNALNAMEQSACVVENKRMMVWVPSMEGPQQFGFISRPEDGNGKWAFHAQPSEARDE